ncbi:MAG: filamentous hemagglutinin N-terminal domain-containing protein, partial [Nitrospira sp.]
MNHSSSRQNPTKLSFAIAVIILTCLTPSGGFGQIVRDGTLGPSGGALTGPNFLIDSTLGVIKNGSSGNNLFHSFSEFNILIGESATFTNSQAIVINNVLSRVTGNNPSTINGLLASEIPGANLYLINPRGVVFGPNAVLEIGTTIGQPGSFFVSTADYVRLGNAGEASAGIFSTHLLVSDVLTSAPVTAFGFLGMSSGTITVQGSALSVQPGYTLGLIGGNVTIAAGVPEGGAQQPAQLSAQEGHIQLASATAAGEFLVADLQSVPNINDVSFSSFGAITLASGSSMTLTEGGKVSIRNGEFTFQATDAVFTTTDVPSLLNTVTLNRGSTIAGAVDSALGGGTIEITTGQLAMDSSTIRSTTIGPGRGMDISMTGNQVQLTGGAQIVSIAKDTGAGGDINVSVSERVSISGYDTEGTLPGVVTFFADPNSGLPLVTSGVFSSASGSGNGGHISVFRPSDSTQDPTIALDNAGQMATLASG